MVTEAERCKGNDLASGNVSFFSASLLPPDTIRPPCKFASERWAGSASAAEASALVKWPWDLVRTRGV